MKPLGGASTLDPRCNLRRMPDDLEEFEDEVYRRLEQDQRELSQDFQRVFGNQADDVFAGTGRHIEQAHRTIREAR